ncbi:MAG TPA: class I SAM-dependent methyltransferase [Candidatus Binatia bacterium]
MGQTELPLTGTCRFCRARLAHTFVDLGMSPFCESILRADQLNRMEAFYPLHVYVCARCFLVQLEEYVAPEGIFTEYAYFSSFSDTWLRHARDFTDAIAARLELGASSRVLELASNDGYLLQYFREKGIPVLGVEPAANVAAVAMQKGIPTRVAFFGTKVARDIVADWGKADLIVGNNVLAQVPDVNDFVAGIKIGLERGGVATLEFPHLMKLVEDNQFDTIYHEHFSYFSFTAAEKIFAAHGLRLFDVEELPTHGGSLRIYACHADELGKTASARALELRAREDEAGLGRLEYYDSFADNVKRTKRRLLEFLIEAKREGKSVVGYGAPGKGNTLLNYCGIRTDFIDYTVDRNPYKHGKFTPGTHIPILPPATIDETKPDYILILPWNIKDEIIEQLAHVRDWGARFVVPIPEVKVYS